MPACEALQDRIELPEPPVTLLELRVQTRLVEFVVTERATVLVKLFTGPMVIVEVPATPAFTVTAVGFALIVKSGCATVVT